MLTDPILWIVPNHQMKKSIPVGAFDYGHHQWQVADDAKTLMICRSSHVQECDNPGLAMLPVSMFVITGSVASIAVRHFIFSLHMGHRS
jgi:hypothetical protein